MNTVTWCVELQLHTVQFASHNPRFTVPYHKQSTVAYCRGLQLHTVQFTAISYSVRYNIGALSRIRPNQRGKANTYSCT